jgi:hypothetical protein
MSTTAIPKTKEIQRIIYSPLIIHNNQENVSIHRIVRHDDVTKIDFIDYASSIYDQGGWVQIHKQTFIRPVGTASELTMIQAINIPVAPVKHYYRNQYDYLAYTLIFPALAKDVKAIDIIEMELPGGSWFNFYGVSLEKITSERLIINN